MRPYSVCVIIIISAPLSFLTPITVKVSSSTPTLASHSFLPFPFPVSTTFSSISFTRSCREADYKNISYNLTFFFHKVWKIIINKKHTHCYQKGKSTCPLLRQQFCYQTFVLVIPTFKPTVQGQLWSFKATLEGKLQQLLSAPVTTKQHCTFVFFWNVKQHELWSKAAKSKAFYL